MTLKNLFVLLTVVFLAIGLSITFFAGPGKSSVLAMVEGGAKGLAGVFFILYYIFMLLGKQPTDKTTH